ncbi:nucleotide exchange factor GrpE [Natronobeatus ordinarius]|uniref:nucleotide exchange factor GrpE n=1 Tax=Natronobeatus ordinarius TaxID=2963433 RepID=UPI0020CB8992|nr:nucleotide exchange factor GrpE [Natronobeatus ordinarius]
MSEDEGTNPATQDVPSGEQSSGDDAEDDPSTADTGRESTDETSTSEHEPADQVPQTSDDVRRLLDRLTELDDELAHEVNAIVETARERNQTVEEQRAELEDLTERLDEQSETIDRLQERYSELEAELEQREAELERRDERIDELEGAYARTQADFQNYKKRAKKRQEQLKARATEDLVVRLVGVRDNLNRALEEESDDVAALREGVEMTLREFDRVLDDENVEEIAPEPGTEVDPQRHEVMVTVDSALPEGSIDDVFAPGYEMGGKVIRSAQVTVSNGELADDRDDATDDEPAADAAVGESGHESDADADDPDEEADGDDEAIELDGEIVADGDVDSKAEDSDDESNQAENAARDD